MTGRPWASNGEQRIDFAHRNFRDTALRMNGKGKVLCGGNIEKAILIANGEN